MANSDIKQLGSHTVIYGAGYVLTRMIPFFLLPFYSYHINLADYGVVQLIYAAIGFMNIIFHYGLDSAYLRFFVKEDSEYGPREVLTHTFVSLLVTGAVLTVLIYKAAAPVSNLLLGDPKYALYIRYSALILMADNLFIIPLHYLRMVNRPLMFNIINIINVSVNFSLNIYFIHFRHGGLESIFLSNLLASLTTLILVSPVLVKNFSPRFIPSLWKQLLIFGLPFVPGGLASMVLEIIGRYMLQWLTDKETVGLYSAGYKLGIFMLVIITAYKFAWQPFFLNKGKDADAPQTFARIMTFFLYVLFGSFLAVTFFIHDLVTFQMFGLSFLKESYWAALPVVPVILAAYIFLGIYMNLLPAIYFTEKTWVIPIFSGSAAAINVAANYFLIPVLGMMGAAWATFIAYLWMAGITWFVTRKWYPIPYEWKRIAELLGTALVSGALFLYFPQIILIKLFALTFFVVVPIYTGVIKLPVSMFRRS